MKKLDKVILVLFSVIIFLQSVLLISVVAGLIDIQTATKFLTSALTEEVTSRVILSFAIICLLCAIKCIFFDSSSDDKQKFKEGQGVLMQNDNGKLLIAKPTLETLVRTVVNTYDSVTDSSIDIELDSLNNVIVNLKIVVNRSVIIKDFTINIQNKIKEEIKKTSDLEVKEINIEINDLDTEDRKK